MLLPTGLLPDLSLVTCILQRRMLHPNKLDMGCFAFVSACAIYFQRESKALLSKVFPEVL